MNDVLDWARQRGLLGKHADVKSQTLKLVSEVGELSDAILHDDKKEIRDALGDIFVVLIILSYQLDVNLTEALYEVLQIISKRTGKTINGTFIKDKENERNINACKSC